MSTRVWAIGVGRAGPFGAVEGWARLSSCEFQRANALRFELDRLRFIQARGALRLVLGERLGIDPCAVPLRQAPDGPPTLPERLGGPCFSVAHAGEHVLCALSDGPVGVDVQQLTGRPPSGELLARACARRERVMIQALPAPEREGRFLELWTRKEALSKLLRAELAMPFDAARVGEVEAIAMPAGGRAHLVGLDIDPRHRGAVAMSRGQEDLEILTVPQPSASRSPRSCAGTSTSSAERSAANSGQLTAATLI